MEMLLAAGAMHRAIHTSAAQPADTHVRGVRSTSKVCLVRRSHSAAQLQAAMMSVTDHAAMGIRSMQHRKEKALDYNLLEATLSVQTGMPSTKLTTPISVPPNHFSPPFLPTSLTISSLLKHSPRVLHSRSTAHTPGSSFFASQAPGKYRRYCN